MTQSLAFWDILPRSCAYSGPVASSAAALITVPIVSEIQRIVHPPCDVVIRVVHQREQAQSRPGLAAHPCLGKNLRQRVTAPARRKQFAFARRRYKPAKKREPSLNGSCP